MLIVVLIKRFAINKNNIKFKNNKKQIKLCLYNLIQCCLVCSFGEGLIMPYEAFECVEDLKQMIIYTLLNFIPFEFCVSLLFKTVT